jgi:hypothetical protein
MEIDTKTSAEVREAIKSAYPDVDALRILVKDVLGEKLQDITSPNQPIPTVVLALFEWCEAKGRLEALLQGATKYNPGNNNLRATILKYNPSLLPSEVAPNYHKGKRFSARWLIVFPVVLGVVSLIFWYATNQTPPNPTKIKLRISSTPAGATIALDQKPQGTTPTSGPLVLEVEHNETQTAQLSVSLNHYMTQTFPVSLGQDWEKDVLLKTSLKITTSPAGATILIGEKSQGTTTPEGTDIEADTTKKIEFVLKLDGYEPKTVLTKPNQTEVVVFLTKIPTPEECTNIGDSRFLKCPDGSFYDKTLTLFWAGKSYDKSTNFKSAEAYIKSYKGGGWDMPSVSELTSLQASGAVTKKLITLTNNNIWASGTKLPNGVSLGYDCFTDGLCSSPTSWAYAVGFSKKGDVFRENRDEVAVAHALPVRRSGR